ncbi:hypothetical protein Q3G72_014321 [Acer saccharum]|nr:hypothetical protein Q3G72_014321 [Acer saccharum]
MSSMIKSHGPSSSLSNPKCLQIVILAQGTLPPKVSSWLTLLGLLRDFQGLALMEWIFLTSTYHSYGRCLTMNWGSIDRTPKSVQATEASRSSSSSCLSFAGFIEALGVFQ